MRSVTLVGLLKIELAARTVLLCDGGSIAFASEQYAARDSLLGVLGGFEALGEGVGEEAPAGSITFLPPDTTSAAALLDPTHSGSRVRIWIGEVDDATGALSGAPIQMADWIVDSPLLTIAAGKREATFSCVSGGDRLFQVNRGNDLSPQFHRGVHPGEAGLDNASGVSTSVPWGAPAAPRGQSAASSGTAAGFGAMASNGYYNPRPL